MSQHMNTKEGVGAVRRREEAHSTVERSFGGVAKNESKRRKGTTYLESNHLLKREALEEKVGR